MKLFRAKIFKKDYQRLKISDNQYTKYIKYLSLLLEGKALPLEARDHTLIGNYSDFKEFQAWSYDSIENGVVFIFGSPPKSMGSKIDAI